MRARSKSESGAATKDASAKGINNLGPDAVDVFLCHNSDDKPKVKEIAVKLKERGIYPWLDEWEISPFVRFQDELQKAIPRVKAAAIFIGPSGIGPWEDMEVEALLQEFVHRKVRMGIVFLPGCPSDVEIPLFLKLFAWVDFRIATPDPFEQLVWGVTGIRPAPNMENFGTSIISR